MLDDISDWQRIIICEVTIVAKGPPRAPTVVPSRFTNVLFTESSRKETL
jgi:hypothetical protein